MVINEMIEKKKMLDIMSVNFENIKRIDRIIASELEKRFAFAEDSVKVLLVDETIEDNADRKEMASIFDMLFEIEEANYDSFFVSENVIRENIFPCGYIFKCIDNTHRLIEYMQYHGEMRNRGIGADLTDEFNFAGYGKKTAEIRITLNERLTFSGFVSYINLCGFQVLQLNYDGEKNQVHFVLDIQNKSYMFSVFMGIIKCYNVDILDFELR